MQRIGLIGIGNIGKVFSEKLLQAGFPLTVLDRDRAKMQHAVDLGAKPADTPGDVADASDVIVFALPGSRPVEEVMEGADGILGRLRAGQLVIDTGTTRPATDIRYAGLCGEKGAGLVDAPITWRSQGLIIMVGGAAEHFAQGREVLDVLSYKVRHIGPIGHGQLLKFVNQMILAGQLAVWCESVEFTKACGLDPALVRDYLEFPVPDALYGDDFSGGGHLALHYKDLGYILEAAHETDAHVPVTNAAHEAFKFAHLTGDPMWAQSGIATYWREMNRRGRD